MKPQLALTALGCTIIAISFSMLLLILLISLKKEIGDGTALRLAVHLCLAVVGVCTFVALVRLYFRAEELFGRIVSRSRSEDTTRQLYWRRAGSYIQAVRVIMTETEKREILVLTPC